MSVPVHVHDEIRRLLWALRDGDFSAADSQKLQHLLANDPEARELYIWYSYLCGSLTWDHSARKEEVVEHEANYGEDFEGEERESEGRTGEQWSSAVCEGQEINKSQFPDQQVCASPALPVSIVLDSSPLAPASSPFYVSHPFLFSNTFALLVTGLGLLGAWLYQVDIPRVGDRNAPSAAISKVSSPADTLEFVGRVTNLIDAAWADEQTATVYGANVSLGRKYALASGLMEISYDSGAKVILEGPVIYRVESRHGGFLSRGRLTAKLEKRGEGSEKVVSGQWPVAGKEGAGVTGQDTAAANHKSEITNHKSPAPAFAVRTPTATVTDLGTEFGVEVHSSGATSAYVFQGTIEIQSLAKNSKAVRLAAHESAHVELANAPQDTAVRRTVVNPASFIRSDELAKLARRPHEKWKPISLRRWQSASQELRRDPSLMAYYDFQQQNGRPTVLPNVAGNGDSKLDGVVENVTWSDGRMMGKHALQFNSVSDYVQIDLPQKVNDLTLAAWIQVQSLDEGEIGILMSSGWNQLGQVHWELTDEGRIALDTYETSGRIWIYKSEPIFDQQRYYHWTHIAVVYDHAAGFVRFYADGHPVGETKIAMITPLCIREARIGQWNLKGFQQQQSASRAFHGRIDEMAIFGRALSAGDIKNLFESGVATSGRKTAADIRNADQP